MPTRIYLDNSATTPTAKEVLDAMAPYYAAEYGNASSLHSFGRAARTAIERARATVADFLRVSPREIVFTSGATEADNLAILGTAFASSDRKHIITSTLEHHAVLHSVGWLESRGYEITRVPVDSTGRVDPAQVRDAIRPDTLLVSIMAGNNEIGTLQPIDELGAACRERGTMFHTDAVQAYGKVELPMGTIDMLSVSAHKLHGPKGVGFLFVRKGVKLAPLLHGGGHEGGRRSGTENVPGIVGLGAASDLAFSERPETTARMTAFRSRLIEEISKIPGTRLNGHSTLSLPHIVNFSFAAIEGESLIMKLDEHGIAASTGSACSSPDLEASHVLLAIGVPLSMAHGSLRVSTGRQTTEQEIEAFLRVLPEVVGELRAMSPFKVGE
ncbi:cysteine desulfurase [Candidatus Bipolaricaulota bacterium]|nr:cysteine desulfurase [Candidatus Bipolaricaulota bacterium]